MPELRELTLRMKSISNSENQIAKRVNSTGNLYEVDIEEIKKNQEEFMRASEICRKPAVLSVFRQRTVTRYKSCASLPLEHTKLDFKSKYRDCTEQLVRNTGCFFLPECVLFSAGIKMFDPWENDMHYTSKHGIEQSRAASAEGTCSTGVTTPDKAALPQRSQAEPSRVLLKKPMTVPLSVRN